MDMTMLLNSDILLGELKVHGKCYGIPEYLKKTIGNNSPISGTGQGSYTARLF